jgi:hypothetical protein
MTTTQTTGRFICAMHGTRVWLMPNGLYRTDHDYYEYDSATDALKAHTAMQESIALEKKARDYRVMAKKLISEKSR